jgi:hypothetical protein
VTELDASIDVLVPAWLLLADVADRLDVDEGRVRELVTGGKLIAVRRGQEPVLQVPADFVGDGGLVKGLAGTLAIFKDDGFSDAEILAWLFTLEPTLELTPMQALLVDRVQEVWHRATLLTL